VSAAVPGFAAAAASNLPDGGWRRPS
jgi:hypothetical protein